MSLEQNTDYGIAITNTINWTVVSKLPTPKLVIKNKNYLDKVCAGYTPEEIQRIANPFRTEADRAAFKEQIAKPLPPKEQEWVDKIVNKYKEELVKVK
jgi:hypothetical protein